MGRIGKNPSPSAASAAAPPPPPPPPPPPATFYEKGKVIPLEQLPAYDDYQGLRGAAFKKDIHRFEEMGAEIRKLTEAKKTLGDYLLKRMTESGAESISVDDYRVTRVSHAGNARLDKTLLIRNGVSVATIQASTVAGKPYEFVKVTGPRGEE